MAKFTLLTNIDFIQRENDDMRVNCKALLITEEAKGLLQADYSLRGFGTDPAWDAFKLWLDKDKHFPFKLEPRTSRQMAQIITDDGMKPLFFGYNLSFGNINIFVQTDNSKKPIDVYTHDDIEGIWEVLTERVISFYRRPNMPYLKWAPASAVQMLLRYGSL